MRGLKTIRSLRTIAAGHAFVQNLRRGHYELTVDVPAHDRVLVAFTDLALSHNRDLRLGRAATLAPDRSTQHRRPAQSNRPALETLTPPAGDGKLGLIRS